MNTIENRLKNNILTLCNSSKNSPRTSNTNTKKEINYPPIDWINFIQKNERLNGFLLTIGKNSDEKWIVKWHRISNQNYHVIQLESENKSPANSKTITVDKNKNVRIGKTKINNPKTHLKCRTLNLI